MRDGKIGPAAGRAGCRGIARGRFRRPARHSLPRAVQPCAPIYLCHGEGWRHFTRGPEGPTRTERRQVQWCRRPSLSLRHITPRRVARDTIFLRHNTMFGGANDTTRSLRSDQGASLYGHRLARTGRISAGTRHRYLGILSVPQARLHPCRSLLRAGRLHPVGNALHQPDDRTRADPGHIGRDRAEDGASRAGGCPSRSRRGRFPADVRREERELSSRSDPAGDGPVADSQAREEPRTIAFTAQLTRGGFAVR